MKRLKESLLKSGLTKSILHRPVTVLMLTLIVIGFGIFFLTKLKVTLRPSVNIPVLAVSAGYRNVPPQDMIRLIAEPLEAAVASLEGVESLETNVRKGRVFIIMRMRSDVNIRAVELKAREAIDRIRNQLPIEATPPTIFQFDPDNQPIMRLSVQANRGLDEIRNTSIELIEPRLERIPGVAAADTRGGLNRFVYVEIDPMKLSLHKMLPADIESAIRSNNVQVPVGNLIVDRKSYSIRAESIFQSIEDIENTIIRVSDSGIPVRINDVAVVKDDYEQITNLVEINQKNSVSIDIQKQSDANTLDVTTEVVSAISYLDEVLPEGYTIQVLSNDGDFIETSIGNLSFSAQLALLIVALVLYLFLGGWRSSLVVAICIPISLAATFVIMYYLDVTLNTISITGLVLALGLLVDSSIVVTENILRKYKQGMSLIEASLAGTNEVKGALLGSTLTTLAVFIPILNVDGMIGMIARDLALTICIAVSISYVTSVVLIPVFASRLLNEKEYQRNTPFMRFIVWLEGLYAKALIWAINRKLVVLGLVFAVLFATVQIYNAVPFQTFPQSESNGFRVNLELPAGTKLVTTAEVLRDFSNTLMADSSFSTVVTEIGSNGQNQESNTGSIEVTVLPKGERTQTPDELMMKYRQRLQFPGANININPRGGGGLPGFGGRGWGGGWGGGNNVRVTLIGSDVMYMQGIADKLESILTLDTLITSVEISRTAMVPELHYILDRQMLAMAGGNINQVANAVKSQARGTQVGQYRVDGREIPIEVRMLEEFRSSRMDLARLEVLQVNDQRIPSSSIGQFESYEGLSRIQRRDRETVMDINIGVIGNPVELESKVRQLIEDQVVLPEGYRYQFAGDGQDARDAIGSLFLALGVALLLIYMVMAGMFENLRDPFVVMFTVPLALFGSVFFLWIIGKPLSILSSLGIIILIGIVVNNGIVLIDFIKQYTTNEDNPKEYISEFVRACVRRMRPIIMTMFTTIMSMLPLSLELGVGSEQWSPLANSIIGGLSLSALFTLFVIPVFYLGISKSKRAIVKAAYAK